MEKKSPVLAPGAKAMCLSPDGKTLWACSTGNTIQRLDPATLALGATIRLDRGNPLDLQATDRGGLFLASGDADWTNILYANVGPLADGATAKAVPWAGTYKPSSILLTPDQSRLYVATLLLSPGNIRSFAVPRSPGLFATAEVGAVRLDGGNARGRLTLSRDGGFLFCDNGRILRVEPRAF